MEAGKQGRSMRSDAAATRQRLIRAGLELFAEHGIDGVSVAALNKKAGAGNASAVHYHFGGVDGLIEAILDEYEARHDAQHLELATVLSETANPTLADEVRSMVAPFANLLSEPEGVAYLRLVGQLLGHPRFAILERHRKLASASRGLLTGMQRAESRDPERWLARRILITSMLFHGLADYARLQGARGRGRRKLPRDAFVEELVQAITAVLER